MKFIYNVFLVFWAYDIFLHFLHIIHFFFSSSLYSCKNIKMLLVKAPAHWKQVTSTSLQQRPFSFVFFFPILLINISTNTPIPALQLNTLVTKCEKTRMWKERSGYCSGSKDSETLNSQRQFLFGAVLRSHKRLESRKNDQGQGTKTIFFLTRPILHLVLAKPRNAPWVKTQSSVHLQVINK